ncbi:MAG: putative signal transducing protein [Planctomycetota bacterium]
MAEDSTVCIAMFVNEFEAHTARSLLESNDIPCFVATDDCGGLRPHMQLVTGARLYVRQSDSGAAELILGEVRDGSA